MSSGCCAAGARCIVPALFTRMSIRPKPAMTAGTSRSVSSRFARFAVKLRACRPFALIAASVAERRLLARVHGDVGAGVGQRQRHARTEPARRARHERNLSRQIEQAV